MELGNILHWKSYKEIHLKGKHQINLKKKKTFTVEYREVKVDTISEEKWTSHREGLPINEQVCNISGENCQIAHYCHLLNNIG